MSYKLYKTINGKDAAMTVGVEPQVSFIFDSDNTDYQAYLLWCSEGNVAQPAEES